MGAIQMSIGAGASSLVSVLQNNTPLPMTGIMACCAIMAFAVFSVGRNIVIHRASTGDVQDEDVEMISTL
jgi:DHA1 family bicyclomycin/chloramphenicol resistance-like MFS transporter